MNETVAVVVPVYNVEKYLHRCIDSILKQTYSPIRLILVNDGSTDGSGRICDEYAAKDGRITVIHQKNGGLSAARNAGLDLIKTDPAIAYVTFIDSDDWILPNTVSLLYEMVKANQVDISICGYIRTTGEETVPEGYPVSVLTPEDFWRINRTNAMIAWGKLYRTSLFADVRYPHGKLNEDEFTTHRVLFQCDRIAVTSAKLYQYFQGPDSIMRKEWTPRRLDCLQAYREQIAFFEQNGFTTALVHSEAAFVYHSLKSKRYLEVYSPQYDEYKPYVKEAVREALKRYAAHAGRKKTFQLWFDTRIWSSVQRKLGIYKSKS